MLLEMSEVRKQCRIDEGFTDEDDLLAIYIGAAEKRTTSYLNRSLYIDAVPDTDPDGLVLSPDATFRVLCRQRGPDRQDRYRGRHRYTESGSDNWWFAFLRPRYKSPGGHLHQ